MLYNKKQVMQFLPHRDPFLFIDGVKEIIPSESMKGKSSPFRPTEIVGAKSICTFKVDQSVKVLEGHFPDFPILPGVVQVEMMAQAASFLTTFCLERPIEQTKLDVQLLGIEAARFRKPVIPPMDLEIHATLTKVRGPIQIYDCEIFANGELMSQTSVMASLKITYN
jgi:3-hydroxyacyl-[acyl-carrier-protein] dehydratase